MFLFKILSFSILCIFTLVFFLCIAAFAIMKIDTPEYVLIPLSTILLTASSFLNSFAVGKVFKEKGIVLGITIGSIFSILITLLAFYFGTFAFTQIFITKISAVMLAGLLGGIIGVN